MITYHHSLGTATIYLMLFHLKGLIVLETCLCCWNYFFRPKYSFWRHTY